MMKKLLILMLVLGLASTASAVLIDSDQTYYFAMQISADGAEIDTGETVTIEIFAGDTVTVSSMATTVLNISAASSATDPLLSDSGDWSTPPSGAGLVTTADGSGGYNVTVGGLITTEIPVDTSIYTVTFVCGSAGTVTIDATSGTWTGWAAVVGPLDGFNDGTEGYEIYGLPYAQVTQIPEPMTIALLGLGGLLLRRRKGGRRK